ncbi:M10 family metallopeptidase C-terminal domain-containing protein [Yersinia bercovieri]|uniref:M10 family metallopeptidase C-terminal domain-containing protein n=1 Tax=Yersinia bercovieri TaxID=634 RepID=UPI0005E4FA81|nr:M10 family metallopeptidase C-terminal domain-containing protein [Yersinia bercovieri]MDN0102480.1 M10 family metallopeptidase C-terminal domain-containing protein [Yersinia bercovieri]CNF72358.1 metalloprotease [Yersinia bercovieri]CNI37350.1 metalloprotease [Yersinia bercovieri]
MPFINRYNKSTTKQEYISYKNEIKTIIAPRIVHDCSLNGEGKYGYGISLNYSFNLPPRADEFLEVSADDVFSFNKMQVIQAKKSMQSWADVANIYFTEAAGDESAYLGFYSYLQDNNRHGAAYHPNNLILSPIYLNSFSSDGKKPTQSNYGAHILTHEIGHTLGLKHTHGAKNWPEEQQHTQQVSIMSYQSEQASGADYGGNSLSTPQLYDIAAVQYLYGPNLTTRTGNTAYGFNSNSDRDFLTANTPTDKLIFCVWDAGGIDTFDFSGYTENQNIYLNELSFSDVGGLVANISIAADVVIENAIGGSGNDKLVGNDVDNILTGGAGADHLWGDEGNNIFRYNRTSDSTSTSSDTIHDFKSDKDKIDLSPLLFGDRNIAMVNRFSFSGQTEIQQKYDAVRDITYLMIDFDNNVYETDMMIRLIGRHQLTLNNFITSPQLTA